MSFQVGWGKPGSIVASNIFLSKRAPRFFKGCGVALGFVVIETILVVVFMVALKRENKKRKGGERNDRSSLPRDDTENLGDDHPEFQAKFLSSLWALTSVHLQSL